MVRTSDHALILLSVQTGLRLSELTGLRQQDLHLGAGAHVRVIGKGRKKRCTPLSKNTRAVLAAWLKELPSFPHQPLFPSARGGHLSAHGVHYLLAKHVATATGTRPSLKHKRVSPHVLRHYLPRRIMSRNFCLCPVLRRKSPVGRDIVRPPIGLPPGGTCSNIDFADLATVA